jgi:heptosyltransferase-3
MIKPKILAIQFKYLGDAVFITPSLHAIKKQFPDSEIHVLVSNEVAPLLIHITWITKIWILPRIHKKPQLSKLLPLLFSLCRENFTHSVDFVGNDRGAILSFLIHTKIRLGPVSSKPKFLQRIAYNQPIAISSLPVSWIDRHLSMLNQAWNTPILNSKRMYISSDKNLCLMAESMLNNHSIICHIGTSQPKKEWPIKYWQELFYLAKTSNIKLAFTAGPNLREQNLLLDLKKAEPEIFALPPINDLNLFLAILNQAKLVIVGDTGPLHFASALGTNVIGLFGTYDSIKHAAPIYCKDDAIISNNCYCINDLLHQNICHSDTPCMQSISPRQVFELLRNKLDI